MVQTLSCLIFYAEIFSIMLKFFSIYILLSSFATLVFADPQSGSGLNRKVFQFIKQETGHETTLAGVNIDYIEEGTDTLLALFHTETFFVACSFNAPNEILAFSFENGVGNEFMQQQLLLKALYKGTEHGKTGEFLTKSAGNEYNFNPFISALFGQTNCHNQHGSKINVSNIYTPNNVAVGCVAISMATVLHHYQWPIFGIGQKTYTDNIGSLRGKHSASFEDTFYNWEKIKTEYDNQASSTEERNALAELAYHSAIALEMDFEATGSTSNINKIPDVLYQHFKHYGEYFSNTSAAFFNRVDSMIMKKSPVVLAISGNGYAHSIVCDGMKTTESGKKYYHLNMGWWGTSNGWYQISNDFNAGGYSSIDGGIFNLVPTPGIDAVKQKKQILLSWDTSDSISFSGFELQAKVGRKNWETIAEIENDSTFQVENDMESTYAFRIRMKYDDFSSLEAWSNIVIIDNTTTSIQQASLAEVKIYPNPVKEKMNIKWFGNNGKKLISVFNVTGKKVKDIEFEGMKTQINTSELKTGIYLITVVGNESQVCRKFIKE